MMRTLIPFDWLLAVITLFCALAHFLILRAPDLQESEIIERIRYIKIAALLILAMRFFTVLYLDGDLIIPVPTQIGLTLFLGAELYRTIYRLFQHKMDSHQAIRSQKDKGRKS